MLAKFLNRARVSGAHTGLWYAEYARNFDCAQPPLLVGESSAFLASGSDPTDESRMKRPHHEEVGENRQPA